MENIYRVGDSVNIHGCNYEVTDYYLSANSNGSYPKVLAKILGINNVDQFVSNTLGYSQFEGKKFGYASIEDANTLINALKNFKGVAVKQSEILKEASIKKYFDNKANLERLEQVSAAVIKLLNNFANIKNLSINIINKVSIKNDMLINAIDSQDIAEINKIESEIRDVRDFITKTNEVLIILNKLGGDIEIDAVEFNAEEFINN